MNGSACGVIFGFSVVQGYFSDWGVDVRKETNTKFWSLIGYGCIKLLGIVIALIVVERLNIAATYIMEIHYYLP